MRELYYNTLTVLRGSCVEGQSGGQYPREVFSICIRSLVYYSCVVKIYVGINATAREVFSIGCEIKLAIKCCCVLL